MDIFDSLSRQRATAAAYDKYSGLSPQNVNRDLLLTELRHKASAAYTRICDARTEMQAVISQNKEIYSTALAEKMEQDAREKFKETVRTEKKALRDNLDQIFDAKHKRLTEYSMQAPSTEQLALLQTFALRTDDVTDTEMEMLIFATVDCYQALAAAKSLLEKHGKTFAMPVNPGERSAALDDAKNRISAAINDLDNEDASFTSREFFQYDGYGGSFTALCAEMDTDPATAITVPELTILQRLEAAQEREHEKYIASLHDSGHGYYTGDPDALRNDHDVKSFIRNNKDVIATEEEKRGEAVADAEKLLARLEGN